MPTDSELQALITEAIFRHLGDQKRDELIKNALKTLLEPEPSTNHWDRDKRSRLQKAYDEAIHKVARDQVEQALVGNEGVKKAIQQIIEDSFKKALETPELRDKLIHQVSQAIVSGFRARD